MLSILGSKFTTNAVRADLLVKGITAGQQVAVLQFGVHGEPPAVLLLLAPLQALLGAGDTHLNADDDALAESRNKAHLQKAYSGFCSR